MTECLQERLGIAYKISQTEKDPFWNTDTSVILYPEDRTEKERKKRIPSAHHTLQWQEAAKYPPIGERILKTVFRVTDQFWL